MVVLTGDPMYNTPFTPFSRLSTSSPGSVYNCICELAYCHSLFYAITRILNIKSLAEQDAFLHTGPSRC